MEKPESWTTEWQASLVKANLEIPYFRSGLTSHQFAEIAGVSLGNICKYAKRGIDEFKKQFGDGCNFEEVPSKKRPSKRLYTFYGYILPPINKPPSPNVLSSTEFAALHKISDGSHICQVARLGHVYFRQRFPGWDFLELDRRGLVWRWYGRIEDIGEQKDEPLPEDNLSISQFARKHDWTEQGLRNLINRGIEIFMQRFPGWMYRRDKNKKLIFCKTGAEPRETLTIPKFAYQTSVPIQSIRRAIKEGCFSEVFPGWQVQPTGLKSPMWIIFPISQGDAQREAFSSCTLPQASKMHLILSQKDAQHEAFSSWDGIQLSLFH